MSTVPAVSQGDNPAREEDSSPRASTDSPSAPMLKETDMAKQVKSPVKKSRQRRAVSVSRKPKTNTLVSSHQRTLSHPMMIQPQQTTPAFVHSNTGFLSDTIQPRVDAHPSQALSTSAPSVSSGPGMYTAQFPLFTEKRLPPPVISFPCDMLSIGSWHRVGHVRGDLNLELASFDPTPVACLDTPVPTTGADTASATYYCLRYVLKNAGSRFLMEIPTSTISAITVIPVLYPQPHPILNKAISSCSQDVKQTLMNHAAAEVEIKFKAGKKTLAMRIDPLTGLEQSAPAMSTIVLSQFRFYLQSRHAALNLFNVPESDKPSPTDDGLVQTWLRCADFTEKHQASQQISHKLAFRSIQDIHDTLKSMCALDKHLSKAVRAGMKKSDAAYPILPPGSHAKKEAFLGIPPTEAHIIKEKLTIPAQSNEAISIRADKTPPSRANKRRKSSISAKLDVISLGISEQNDVNGIRSRKLSVSTTQTKSGQVSSQSESPGVVHQHISSSIYPPTLIPHSYLIPTKVSAPGKQPTLVHPQSGHHQVPMSVPMANRSISMPTLQKMQDLAGYDPVIQVKGSESSFPSFFPQDMEDNDDSHATLVGSQLSLQERSLFGFHNRINGQMLFNPVKTTVFPDVPVYANSQEKAWNSSRAGSDTLSPEGTSIHATDSLHHDDHTALFDPDEVLDMSAFADADEFTIGHNTKNMPLRTPVDEMANFSFANEVQGMHKRSLSPSISIGMPRYFSSHAYSLQPSLRPIKAKDDVVLSTTPMSRRHSVSVGAFSYQQGSFLNNFFSPNTDSNAPDVGTDDAMESIHHSGDLFGHIGDTNDRMFGQRRASLSMPSFELKDFGPPSAGIELDPEVDVFTMF